MRVFLSILLFFTAMIILAVFSIPREEELVYALDKSGEQHKLLKVLEGQLASSDDPKIRKKVLKLKWDLNYPGSSNEFRDFLRQNPDEKLLEKVLEKIKVDPKISTLESWLDFAFEMTKKPAYLEELSNWFSFYKKPEKQKGVVRTLFQETGSDKHLSTLVALGDIGFVIEAMLSKLTSLSIKDKRQLYRYLIWENRAREGFEMVKNHIPLSELDNEELNEYHEHARFFDEPEQLLLAGEEKFKRSPQESSLTLLIQDYSYYGRPNEAASKLWTLYRDYKVTRSLPVLYEIMTLSGPAQKEMALQAYTELCKRQGQVQDIQFLASLILNNQGQKELIPVLDEILSTNPQAKTTDFAPVHNLYLKTLIIQQKKLKDLGKLELVPMTNRSSNILEYQAKKNLAGKGYEAAKVYYERLMNAQSLNILMQASLDAGDLKGFESLVEKAFEKYKDAELYAVVPSLQQTPWLQVYENLANQSQNTIGLQILLERSIAMKKPEISEKILNTLRELKPRDDQFGLQLAYLYLDNQQTEEAFEVTTQLYEKGNKNLNLLLLHADLLFQRQQFTKAQELYSQILPDLRKDSAQRKAVMRALIALQRNGEALAMLEEDYRMDRLQSSEDWTRYLQLLADLNQWDQVIERLDSVPKDQLTTGLQILKIQSHLQREESHEASLLANKLLLDKTHGKETRGRLYALLGYAMELERFETRALEYYIESQSLIEDPDVMNTVSLLESRWGDKAHVQLELYNRVIKKEVELQRRKKDRLYKIRYTSHDGWENLHLKMNEDGPERFQAEVHRYGYRLEYGERFRFRLERSPLTFFPVGIREKMIKQDFSVGFAIKESFINLAKNHYRNRNGKVASSLSFSIFHEWLYRPLRTITLSYFQEVFSQSFTNRSAIGFDDFKAVELMHYFRFLMGEKKELNIGLGISYRFPSTAPLLRVNYNSAPLNLSYELSVDPFNNANTERMLLHWKKPL